MKTLIMGVRCWWTTVVKKKAFIISHQRAAFLMNGRKKRTFAWDLVLPSGNSEVVISDKGRFVLQEIRCDGSGAEYACLASLNVDGAEQLVGGHVSLTLFNPAAYSPSLKMPASTTLRIGFHNSRRNFRSLSVVLYCDDSDY